MLIEHKCVSCGGCLSGDAGRIKCAVCGVSWPVIGGIPVFECAEYSGGLRKQELEHLLALTKMSNWHTAARRQFKQANPVMYQYIADLNRASWIPLLPVTQEATVLEVGAGFGALTHALALHYQRVVAIEPVGELIRFLKARVEHELLENVALVRTTPTTLPFFEGTFDLVVLNGLLARVAQYQDCLSPREAQAKLLRKCRHLLKPGGTIVMGVENRIGYRSLSAGGDSQDGHMKRLAVGGSPQFQLEERRSLFRDIFTRLGGRHRSRGSRTIPGYIRLLRKAGFRDVQGWWPPSGYDHPRVLYSAVDRARITAYFLHDLNFKNRFHGHTWLRMLKHWAVVHTRLIHAMLPEVVLVASVAGPVSKRNTDSSSLATSLYRVAAQSLASFRDASSRTDHGARSLGS